MSLGNRTMCNDKTQSLKQNRFLMDRVFVSRTTMEIYDAEKGKRFSGGARYPCAYYIRFFYLERSRLVYWYRCYCWANVGRVAYHELSGGKTLAAIESALAAFPFHAIEAEQLKSLTWLKDSSLWFDIMQVHNKHFHLLHAIALRIVFIILLQIWWILII